MRTRVLGRTGRKVSVVGLGAWQLGGDWGDVPAEDAREVLTATVTHDITLIDTADVYGDGRSERFVGELLASPAGTDRFVATKMGRRVPQLAEYYQLDNFRNWIDRSRRHLGVEALDLVQLHCPPTAVYRDPAVVAALDTLVAEGRIRAYGVSVETCDEALAALEWEHLATIQIIVNCFRQKPLAEVLPAARAAGVGILARVPLASGLLSGRYDADTSFPAEDHRSFNRRGEAFDVGETFAGVPYEVGLAAVRELAPLVPESMTMAQFALRWVLDQPGVTAVIPGARSAAQVAANAAAGDLPGLTPDQLAGVREVYDRHLRAHVHDRW